MSDRLAALLSRFAVRTQAFHAGALCGINALEAEEPFGQLHLVRDGEVEVRHDRGRPLHIRQPSLLLYPRPMRHRFVTDDVRGADFVCAHVQLGAGGVDPIADALPAVVCLPLARLERSRPVLDLLFEEAAGQNCGRQAMLDRLFEIVLIAVLRELMEQGVVRGGMLAGLAHPQLRHALVAMHEAPQADWSLAALASRCGMSRTAFAVAFRDAVGYTPGQYLQRWRIALAQTLLRRGRALKTIAADVGYGSEAALSRAFTAQVGQSPRAWRQAERGRQSSSEEA